jgi:hypothetical protein
MKRWGWSRTAMVLAAFVLIAGSVSGCKSSTTSDPPTDQRIFTSSTEVNHSHTVTIEKTDITAPLSGGISLTTTSSSAYGGHTHAFVMSRDQLLAVMGGSSVVITTGSGDGGVGVHTHTFTILKWF